MAAGLRSSSGLRMWLLNDLLQTFSPLQAFGVRSLMAFGSQGYSEPKELTAPLANSRLHTLSACKPEGSLTHRVSR